MEEDTEVLDWGHDDDELNEAQVAGALGYKQIPDGFEQEDDAVSLGDDEEEDIFPYKQASQDDTATIPPSTPRASTSSQQNGNTKQRDVYRAESVSSQKSSRQNESPTLRRTQSVGKMVHALPPKPIVATPVVVHSPPALTTLASAMGRKLNGHGKAESTPQILSLPPDWEERYPRDNGREPYYYNVRTHKSTWVHPGAPSSGTDSPAKDLEASDAYGVGRSPEPDFMEQEDRAPLPRERNRRTSAAGLSYGDRHYRPSDDVALAGPKQHTDRRDSLHVALPLRPVSPLSVDARRPRSITPPRKRDSIDPHRVVRPRRERTPPPERNTQRARSREQADTRFSSQDRNWISSRNGSPPHSNVNRGPDTRSKAPRGRRDRSPLPLSTSVHQSARNDTNEWSASRPRSSLHLREVSPPRKYVNAPAYSGRPPLSPPRQKGRHERSPSPNRFRAASHVDSYVSDTVPQRRTREDEPEHDLDVKRRRMDRFPAESARSRDMLDDRALRVDKVAPFAPPDTAESARSWKRDPLPTQDDQFRSASRTTLPLEMPSALQGPQSYSHRATSDTTVTPRVMNGLADVPSGLRSQEPQLHTRDLPTRLGGRGRTRFDNGISQMNREAEAMEVEEYPVSRPIQVPSGINSERAPLSPTVPPNGTPTGPRAMSLNLSNVATALPPQEDNRQRAVMPHNRPNTFTAHSPLLTSDEANIQSYDYRKDRVSSQSGPKNTEQRDIPPRSSRWGEPSAQNTGSNTAPPRAGRPPGGQHAPDLNPTHVAERPRYHQGPSEFSERSRFDKDHDKPSTRSSSYKSTSPVDRLKVLPVVNEAGTRWPGREEAHKTMDDSPALPSRPALNERDADQSGMHKGVDKSARPTRFGPERTQSVAAADNEPRQWLTREEAARSGLVQPTSHTRGPNVAPVPTSRHPGRRVDMEHTKYGNEAAYSPTEQRTPVQPPPDAVAFRRNEGREDIRRDRRSSVVERPSLEGRLSSTRDRDRVSHDDRQPDRSSNGYDDQGRFATHPHPERTRSMAPPPTTDPEMFDGRANAIKNRRKARPSEQNGGSGFPRDSDRDAPYIVDSDSGTAPPRRGGSLLDRLTEPTHDVSGPPPSLRQRVDGPLTGIAGLPARPPAEVTLNAINATELKTPRRKPKKGVRRG